MKMNVLILIGGLGVVACAGNAACAASPTYCALYAREYAHQSGPLGADPGTPKVEDLAYSRCLNSDEDPPLPQGSAYFGTVVGREHGYAGDPAQSQELTHASQQIAGASSTTDSDRPSGRSRLTPGTAEWTEWCSSHYPNSFDPDTGTIIPSATGMREFC